MNTLLVQALFLTLAGMTMTFAAIGLLVVGMYVLTAIAKDERPRRKPVVVKVERSVQSEAEAKQISQAVFPGVTLAPEAPRHTENSSDENEAENRRRAAAVAVAIALAMQSTTTASTPPVDSWSTFVRGHHLAQRQRYHARRHGTRRNLN